MDLSSWGPRKLLDFSKSTLGLYDFIGDLLDGERSLLEDGRDAVGETVFEPRSDLEALGNLVPSRGSARAKVDAAFAGLSAFYEAGFHFHRQDGAWKVSALFLYGRHFAPAKPQPAPFEPPIAGPGTVVRGRSAPVLSGFRLESLTRLRDSETFVFDVDSDSLFVLISEKPHPWLDDHIRRTRATLDTLFVLAQKVEDKSIKRSWRRSLGSVKER